MTRRRRVRRPRPSPTPQKVIPLVASTEETISEEHTISPEHDAIPITWAGKGTSDTTPEDITEERGLQTSTAGLIQWILLGGLRPTIRQLFLLTCISYVAMVAWLFLQDNNAGRLETAEGLGWFWVKLSYVSVAAAVLIVVLAIAWGVMRFQGRRITKS